MKNRVATGLFLYAICALGVMAWLTAIGQDVPESLIATLATSVGALAGLASK